MRNVGLFLVLGVSACSSSPSSASSSHFAAAVTYATGNDPSRILSADFNADGASDLVIANGGDSTIGVFISKGDGTFKPQATYAAVDPSGMAIADINHDRHPDIIVASVTGIGVLLNNGDGTFGALTSVSTGMVMSAAAADFDGDGYDDVVTLESVNLDEMACLYLNDKAGGLQPSVCTRIGTGSNYAIIGTGVIDGSALPKVFVSELTIAVFAYGYDATAKDLTSGLVVSDSGSALSVSVVDVNGDGHPDLVIGDGALTICLANGAGGFDSPTTSGTEPTEMLAAALFNTDSDPDVALIDSNRHDVHVLYGDGQGGLSDGDTLARTNGSEGWLTVGDFNGDGHPDIAVANGNVNTIGVYISKW